ncbi:MAG: hypothetical protein AAB393_09195 [Bacteroidota bacterium]
MATNTTLEALRAAWDFIENVTDDDPERSDKFFKLRVQVSDAIILTGRNFNGEATKPIVGVILEGGLVQSIVSNAPEQLPDMDLIILDYDVQGCEEDELLKVPQSSGGIALAVGHIERITESGIDLEIVLEQMNARGW